MITRKQLLQELNISTHVHDETVLFHDADKGCIPSEDRLVVKKANGGYEVYIEHRTSREENTFEKSEEAAMAWAILTYLRRFRSVIDQRKSNQIMDYEEQGDQEAVDRIMQEVSDYIAPERKDGVISYKESDGIYTISYGDAVLCENIDRIRWRPVLYNFASLLKFVDMFLHEYADYMRKVGVDLDEARCFFVTKKRYHVGG